MSSETLEFVGVGDGVSRLYQCIWEGNGQTHRQWLYKQMLEGLDWDLSSNIPNPPGVFGLGVERE